MRFYDKKQMEKNYEILRNFYGTHKKTASALGITHDHYRKVRNKRVVMSLCLRKFISFLAESIDIAQKK